MTTVVIDYGSGNLRSAAKALERAARESGADGRVLVTNHAESLRGASRVVLPGVGAFADCRRGLDAIDGMVEALNETVLQRGKPFFGICVGMQLMAERGREYQVTPGLGWIAGEVDRIVPKDASLKIPHMGWNTLSMLKPQKRADLVAQADYGGPLTAVVGRDNMVGTQFHPEKSQRLGLKLIANFLKWAP